MPETRKITFGCFEPFSDPVFLFCFLFFLSGVCASKLQEFFRLAIQAGIEADSVCSSMTSKNAVR